MSMPTGVLRDQWVDDMGGSYQINTNDVTTVASNSGPTWAMTNSINGQGYVFPKITTALDTDFIWGSSITGPTITGPTAQLSKCDVEFQGDVKIKGKSLLDTLELIEDRLAILHPNPELEEKWENLRGLRKMYMDLEKEIIEQEKMWAVLKK